MTKEDWIILRLLRGQVRLFSSLSAQAQRDYTRSLIYIINKYGEDVLIDCIDQLVLEKA